MLMLFGFMHVKPTKKSRKKYEVKICFQQNDHDMCSTNMVIYVYSRIYRVYESVIEWYIDADT